MWLAEWLNHFVFDVIWTATELFLKLHSYISVLWQFCRISVFPSFHFWEWGSKWKPANLYFWAFCSQTLLIFFLFMTFCKGRWCNYFVKVRFPWFPWFLCFPRYLWFLSFRPVLHVTPLLYCPYLIYSVYSKSKK